MEGLGIVLLFLSCWGLGHLISYASSTSSSALTSIPNSFRLLLGLISVGPIFMLGSLIFQLPFTALTFFILILSLIGFWKRRACLKPDFKEVLVHSPIGLAIFGYLAVLLIFDAGYTPRHWDEFSYWLTYPKQMMLFDRISSADFYDKVFTNYLPGLPALQIFNQKVHFQSHLNSAFSFAPNYLFGLALLWLISDQIRTVVTKHGELSKVVFTFFIVLVSVFILAKEKLILPNARIELPCIVLFTFILWSLHLYLNEKIEKRSLYALMFFFAIGGYSLKEYYILLPGAFFVFMALDAIVKKELSLIGFSKSFLITISGFILLMVVWKISTRNFEHIHDFSRHIKTLGFTQAFENRKHLLPLAAKELFLYLIYIFSSIIPVIGLWRLKVRSNSASTQSYLPFWGFYLSFSLVYLCTLMWSYLFSASDSDALVLNSFDRYLSYIILPLFFAGLLVFLENFSFKTSLFERYKLRIPSPLVMTLLAVLFMIPTLGYLKASEPETSSEVSRIAQYLNERLLGVDSLSLIDQKDNGHIYVQALYYSLDHKNLMGKFLYGWRYSPADFSASDDADNDQMKAADALASKLSQHSVIWIRHADDFIKKALRPMVNNDCPENLSFHFLIKNPNHAHSHDQVPGQARHHNPDHNLYSCIPLSK